MHRPMPSPSTSNASTESDAALEIETFTICPNEGHKAPLGTFCEGATPKFRVIYHDQ
jgi:hypothetical protein